jgi:predicted nucleotidyltransferase
MNTSIINHIKALKDKYEAEDIQIAGVFGSVARNEETPDSDVDVLFRTSEVSFNKYPGWEFFSIYEHIKSDIESELGCKIDLVDEDALNRVGKKYILPEVIYLQ